jgi:hypothetical protein
MRRAHRWPREAAMGRCFVIQPFDGAGFDDRYDDVLAPAIRAASLEPNRVDRDPRTTVVIDDIHAGIQDSVMCLADITLDNPNVWYELGYALASDKDVVLICLKDRTTPFLRHPAPRDHAVHNAGPA